MTESTMTDREEELLGRMTAAFAGHEVSAEPLEVNKLGGGTASTLRFSIDNAYSADVERARIAEGESIDALAGDLEAQLRDQTGDPGPQPD